ncbi:cryptochrome/photolyase family protein [bacterium]|nr:cryptochrome/photolyase family protein [bacterium]NCQ55534.1 cryptochrome/photolyase family protein [Candidatus Parcubacteria bacterium]NCS67545.1 cryptochrome/photolyase family protein [Candidatus Peregrinibacteria bacterium]NCS96290.1 cryptochrome/photolyase family protein [bacterium]
MKTALFIFPHQLFKTHPGLASKPDLICLIEDSLFFGDQKYPLKFHKQKLVLHRASLHSYKDELTKSGKNVHYFEMAEEKSKLSKIFEQLEIESYKVISVCEVTDFILEKRLKRLASVHNMEINWLESPLFLNSSEVNHDYQIGKKKLLMAEFYKQQRERLKILMNEAEPQGGQWSFDEENRKKLPKTKINDLPLLSFPPETEAVSEAKKYVEKHYKNNPGSLETFLYPINHEQAESWLQLFLSERFKEFGPYEDAIEEGQNWLYHSVLTPMLNIGLLTPEQVVNEALEYAEMHNVPIASVEGFIRQIIGWREFMRLSYETFGVKMRTTNHWQHRNKMPTAFYTAETGITPIDDTIKRILETGYCHHIERLMVLGGFMFLCEIDPDEIYTWFMEMFIDSYDWVMVPNVYAMSQNADGGLITTKPYFSGSNYIKKMSHYQTGGWADIWDALYWNWILKNSEELKQNHRWSMMVAMANKMDDEKKGNYQKMSEEFKNSLEF